MESHRSELLSCARKRGCVTTLAGRTLLVNSAQLGSEAASVVAKLRKALQRTHLQVRQLGGQRLGAAVIFYFRPFLQFTVYSLQACSDNQGP